MTNSLLRITALGLSKVLHSQPLDVAHAARMADRIVELTGPGAAPVQQEPEPIQVCRLMKKEEGIWVAASEFYAGHPDQKWVKLVSTNPGSWSIQRRVTGKQIADGLAKALAGTPPALEVTECQWSFEDDSGTWRSSCGELWSFIDGGPNENRVTYCHHCGGKVSNAAAAPAAKVPKWVPISERFPPDDAPVLLWHVNGRYEIDSWQELYEDPTGMGGPQQAIGYGWNGFDYEDITHWMTLPEAPE